jgi:hypothetical protein
MLSIRKGPDISKERLLKGWMCPRRFDADSGWHLNRTGSLESESIDPEPSKNSPF